MNAADIFFTILLNGIPLIILIIPLFFIWKKYIGKLYFRIVIGIFVFYLIYWILPILFQIGEEPKRLAAQEGNWLLGVKYIAAHMGSIIALFAHYPLVTLPFIFFIAPFISLVFLRIRLRKGEGFRENLKQLTYEYTESPFRKIRNEVLRNNWKREKKILKLMILFSPMLLYLLQVILDLLNLKKLSLAEGFTSLGWFLEILFVYFAIFIFSIELLLSSKIAFKGRYIGEEFRDQMYKSLYTVGAPISLISLILSWVQYGTSIYIMIYFFAYFVLASIIFVLFLDIFEPVSILIFIKLVDWWKNKEIKIKNIDKTNWYYGIILGCFGVFIFLMLNLFVGIPLFNLFGDTPRNIINSAKYDFPNPTLQNSFRFDMMNMYSFVMLIVIPIIITSLLMAYCLKHVKDKSIGISTFLTTVILFSILFIIIGANPLINLTPEEYWLTGQASYTDVFGFRFYVFRTAAFDANLFPGGRLSVLGIIAAPYIYTRYIFNIIIWTIMIYHYGKDFKVKNIPFDDKNVEKAIFSTVNDFIKYEDYMEGKNRYLITKNEGIIVESLEQEKEEVQSLLKILKEDKLLNAIIPTEEKQKKKLYFTLKYLYKSKQINIWKPEFSFILEKIEKQGLYVIYDDGRGVYDYEFIQGGLQDAGLISGMFTAISSFIKETTRSTQWLKTIDHGDISILIDYGEFVFGALFIKGSQNSDIRDQLKEFVDKFEEKHGEVLNNWNGYLTPFRESHRLVEEIFKKD